MGAIAGLVQRLAASLSRAEKREKFVAGEQGEVGVATALHGFLPDSQLRTKTPTLAGHVSHTHILCHRIALQWRKTISITQISSFPQQT